MAKPRYRRKRRQNRFGIFLATIVVLLLMLVVSVKSVSLMQKEKSYQAREEQLQTQIDAEKKRSEDIKEFAKYTQTKKYIEEVAKDKLGLVYPGENIFKNDSDK